MFLLGEVLHFIVLAFELPLSMVQLNLIYMAIGTVFLLICMRRYLQASFVRYREYGVRNLLLFLAGYGIRIGLSIPISILLLFTIPDFIVTPNTDAVLELVAISFLPTAFLAVVLAPIVEEILFRGVLFGSLVRKNRILAYVVSTLIFAFLHIRGFLFNDPSPTLLLVMLIYIPPGLALAWVYEKSGSLWTPIFLHALMNLIAIALSTVMLM